MIDNEVIEKLKKCAKSGTPLLIKPETAEKILFALGIRL